jgi:hypothetical protein
MVRKLHKSWPGGHVYMLVVVDKFTKWIEAAPVTTQDSIAAINFIKSVASEYHTASSQITGQISHRRSSRITVKDWELN